MIMNAITHRITTEVPPSYIKTLLDFIYVQYLFPQAKKFSRFSQKEVEGIPTLSYIVLNQHQQPVLEVEIKGTTPLYLAQEKEVKV